MSSPQIPFCVGVLLLASSAFAGDVKVSHAENVDFTKPRTYAVNPRTPAADAKVQTRIETNIDAVLKSVGWNRVDSGADIEVVTIAYTQEQVDAGVDDLWSAAEGSAPPVVDVRDITEGILTIDLIDKKTGAHIWRAAAHKKISNDQDADKNLMLIDKTVKQMFKGFSPK